MAISAATLRVDVDMNTGAAERQLTGFGQKLNGFAAGAARAGSAMFTGLAMGAGIAIFNKVAESASNAVASIGGAVAAASDLSETISMISVVMGDWGDDVVQWSEGSAAALGMTQNAALTAAGTFAAFGKAAGMGGEETTKFSTELVGLAADMASFFNTSPEEALAAIASGLRGEAEPLRRFNVLLDDATMRQTALKMGIIETTKQALTPQQKVLVATAEVWRQTGDAQGDFARTSGGLAGQQKILTANMDALSVTVGQALLPAMTAFTTAGNQIAEAVLPNLGNMINTFVVPAMTDLATYIGEVGVKFGEFMAVVKEGGDPIGAFIETFDLKPWADQINGVIIAFDKMNWQWEFDVANMKFSINEWAIGFAVATNKVLGAINTILAALVELDAKQRIVAGGMALITGNLGAAYNLLMAAPTTFTTIPPVTVPNSTQQPVQDPFVSTNTISTSGWGAGSGPGVFDAGGGWGAGSAAREAADKAAAAAATLAADGLKGTFSAATLAANSVGDLAGAASAAAAAADKFESAFRGVPGLFGTSKVTEGDMAKAAAGMPVNFADDYVRQVGDELLNGVDLANIDPAEVAASLGMDPSVPAQLIYDELVRQWGSGEYFANPDNVAKVNWTAVQAKLDQDARAVLGQSNILAGAIAQGITLDSMAPVASATVSGLTGALEASNLGAATGAAAIAAVATPEAVANFTASGESAFNSWRGGWETAWENWSLSAPIVPPGTQMNVNQTAAPIPITIEPLQSPGSRSANGTAINITINGADPGRAGAVGRATASAVLDALRARGRV